MYVQKPQSRLWVWVAFLVIEVVVLAVMVGAFGRWEYRRGFAKGADTAVCAFAINRYGSPAATTYFACRGLTDRMKGQLLDELASPVRTRPLSTTDDAQGAE
jgi:hypothetical protein